MAQIFAAPLPLAPLLAIIALSIALRTGAYRVLYASRRNIPFIAKSIGMLWKITVAFSLIF